MIHDQSPSVIGGAAATDRRPAESLSQGDKWNRHISRYIVLMSPSGKIPEPAEHITIGEAALALSQAMTAKLGDAAKVSRPGRRQARTLPFSADEVTVILRPPIDRR
jgi:hypothetical protein